MYRFLLQPKWIVGHLLVIVTVITFVNLGLWQLGRLEARQTRNALITTRLAAPPQPLDQVLSDVGGDAELAQFRRVEVDGTFAAGQQLLTAPRSFEGRPGQQVLSLLQRDGRPAVLVDRGWIPFDRAARPPPVPDGAVRIEGIVRAAEPGDIGGGAQVARIAPGQIAERLDRPLEVVFVQAAGQSSPAPGSPRPTPLPELTEGSHRSYAVQWFTFALIALSGYLVLIWRNAPPQTAGSDTQSSGTRRRDVTGTSVP